MFSWFLTLRNNTPTSQISQSYTKIRYGPLRMGVTAKLLRRLTAPEALAQAHFSPKKGGAIAYALIDSICAVAKRKYGLLPEELMVDRCFVTQGPGTKRVKIMGRGRSGLKFIRSSHLNVTLKEIDFEAMIAAAESKNAKRKWAKMRDDAAALRDKEGNSETGDEKGSGNAATDSNTTS
jgi:ribosomal protein L22